MRSRLPTNKSRSYLLNVAVAVITVAAVLAVGLRVRDEIEAYRARQPQPPTSIADWKAYANAGHRTGSSVAPVVVVMFSDFQCPFCRNADRDLAELRAEQPSMFSILYRHYPLSFHEYAHGAALAAVCADRQGAIDRMHDLLFANRDSLGKQSWSEYARLANVSNISSFDSCINSAYADSMLRADSVAGEQLRIRGTPTFLINDLRVVGYPGKDSILAYIRRAAQVRR